jgi:hypothetical protein
MADSDALTLETSGGNKGNHEPTQSKCQDREVKLKCYEIERGQQSALKSVEEGRTVAC